MDLLASWRYDNYLKDMPSPTGFHFNSGKRRLHEALDIGSTLGLASGIKRHGQLDFVLLAGLVVSRMTINPPGYGYGEYRIIADPQRSRYFDSDGPDMTDDVLRHLAFVGGKAIGPSMDRANIPMALLSMRSLTAADTARLVRWADGLRVVPTAFVPPTA